jgi:signal transduction histidine kinase
LTDGRTWWSRITDATRTAATGSLTHRIELPGRSDEFRELADSFDAMLARLEAHVAEQQRFAANASHELRTPLAITQTLSTSPATVRATYAGFRPGAHPRRRHICQLRDKVARLRRTRLA